MMPLVALSIQVAGDVLCNAGPPTPAFCCGTARPLCLVRCVSSGCSRDPATHAWNEAWAMDVEICNRVLLS